ncbi:MAG: cytochrome C peroxidase [Bacteroidia bacterium]|jgi:cytochrome c peroxidase|nr:cytochrome C peroxidase [Bacteroidia bacterium]
MKKNLLKLCLLLLPALTALYAFGDKENKLPPRSEKAVAFFAEDAALLLSEAQKLQALVSEKNVATAKVNEQIKRTRVAYKRTQLITAYFYPATEQMLNGPPIPEADEEEGTQLVRTPDGLQHIAELADGDSVSGENLEELRLSCRRFTATCFRLPQLAQSAKFDDWQLMEALRLEVIRIYTLGLTGFDAPDYEAALADAKAAAESIKKYAALFLGEVKMKDRKLEKNTRQAIDAFVKGIDTNSGEDEFNRLSFIRTKANPLSQQLTRVALLLNLKPAISTTALRFEAATPFEKDAFDPWFYARYTKAEYKRREAAELGRILFFEPLLSGDGIRSCASCHRPEQFFTDGIARSTAFTGNGTVLRNAPTLWNAALQPLYFYDARVPSLEDQARLVVANSIELHGDIQAASSLLMQSSEYAQLFRTAFGGTEDTVISPRSIFIAIAAYQRTLLAGNAPFYQYMRGETKAISAEAINGFNIFTGKAACATCHFLPYFSGSVPPFYAKGEVEIIGVPAGTDTLKATIDSDQGRYSVNGMELHRHAFKTPGLSQVAHTAPYMHNGVYTTLDEVIDFYNRGGGTGLGIAPVNQTLPEDKLALTPKEKADLIAFLHTLTDTTAKAEAPLRLPAFGNTRYDSRKPGGLY